MINFKTGEEGKCEELIGTAWKGVVQKAGHQLSDA